MSAEYDRAPDRSLLVDDVRSLITTVEGAEEARRHAAEIGDYAMAQRWLWHERQLAAQDAHIQTSIPGTSTERRHDPAAGRPGSAR
jgi:hypothetical protein